MDSSGFEAHHVSRYFIRRKTSGKFKDTRTYRHFPKLALLGDCRSHLILAALSERGPSPDFGHVDQLVTAAQQRAPMRWLLADAGYDAEWVHMFLRVFFGTRTVIPPEHGRPGQGLPAGYYRKLMKCRFNHRRYGQRWQVETIFSMIKRRLGDCLGARKARMQRRALQLKVLVHGLMIVALIRQVFYRAAATRFRRALSTTWDWCRSNRHLPLHDQWKELCAKLRGHNAYYGITGNTLSLAHYRYWVRRTWRYWLSRRSQRSHVRWDRFALIEKRYPLPAPKRNVK